MDTATQDTTTYKVVVNHENQHSLWPADRENAPGWNDAGMSGSKQDCLAYVDTHWTDLRPLSLQQAMAERAREAQETVRPLTEQPHPITLPWSDLSALQLAQALERGFIAIAFPAAPSLPAIGIFLEPEHVNRSQADFSAATGVLHAEGTGTIYAVGKVRASIDLDIATMTGQALLTLTDAPTS